MPGCCCCSCFMPSAPVGSPFVPYSTGKPFCTEARFAVQYGKSVLRGGPCLPYSTVKPPCAKSRWCVTVRQVKDPFSPYSPLIERTFQTKVCQFCYRKFADALENRICCYVDIAIDESRTVLSIFTARSSEFPTVTLQGVQAPYPGGANSLSSRKYSPHKEPTKLRSCYMLRGFRAFIMCCLPR